MGVQGKSIEHLSTLAPNTEHAGQPLSSAMHWLVKHLLQHLIEI